MIYGRVFLIYISILLASFASSLAFAQSKSQTKTSNSVSLFEARSNIEELISQRLSATIATSLDKKNFEVGVSVELIEAPQKTSSLAKPITEKSAIPQFDFASGLIDADSLIENYEKQIEELRTKQSLMIQNIIKESSSSSQYLVKSIHVHVGLTDSLGESYKVDFSDWLKKTIEKNYGNLATSEVSFIKTAPKSDSKSLLEYISELQGLIAALLVGAFAVLAIILMKIMGSKDAQEQRKLAAQLQQQMQMKEAEKSTLPQIEEAREVFEEEPELVEPVKQLGQFEVDLLHGLHNKVIRTAHEAGDKVQEILKFWLENGDRGYFKTACLVDAMISHKDSHVVPIKNIDWQDIVPVNARKKMREFLEQMSALKFEEKTQILDEVYWDLVSLKLLGSSFMLQPFQFVATLPTKEIKTILSSQNTRTQTLAVLYLPDEARTEYIKDLPFDSKKTLIEETLQMDEVLTTDIEAASETLKFKVNQMEGGKETISVKSMYSKILDSCSAFEEINLLREVSKKISDGGASIKSSYPTLAFIDEWPEAKVRLVFDSANADEVLALLRIMPEAKDKVLACCPSRVQTIVNGDFDKEDKTDAALKDKHLSSLKLKFIKIINKQKIDLETIFVSQRDSKGDLRVA